MKQSKPLKESKALVIGEYAGNHETLLTRYLAERVKKLVFIEVILTRYYRKKTGLIRVTAWENGQLKSTRQFGKAWDFLLRFEKTRRIFLHFAAALLLFFHILKQRTRFDIGIASGVSFFSVIALLFRSIGVFRQVIFICVFPSASTFKGPVDKIFQKLQYYCDRLSHSMCNAIWYQTRIMKQVKLDEGMADKPSIPKVIVPIGIEIDESAAVPDDRIERRSIGYVGRLSEDIGLDMVIDAFADVVREVPDARLKIIGSGPTQESLERQVKALGIEKNVTFYGFIGEREWTAQIMSSCAASLAPYVPGLADDMRYADTSKVKEYIQFGLPVIVTKVPEVAEEIQEEKAGFAVDYEKQAFADAMMKLLTDDELWLAYRANIRKLGKKYDCRELYDRAFTESGYDVR